MTHATTSEIEIGDMVRISKATYCDDALTGTTWIVVEIDGQDVGLSGNAFDETELWMTASRCQPA